MQVKMGTSLSALSLTMLDVKANTSLPKEGEAGFAVRMLSVAEIEERQKQQKLARINAAKKKQSEMDTFYLKFCEYRQRGISESPTKMAKVMDGSADEHILTTNSDTGMDELTRKAKQLTEGLDVVCAAGIDAKAGDDLTDREIRLLLDKTEQKPDDPGKEQDGK